MTRIRAWESLNDAQVGWLRQEHVLRDIAPLLIEGVLPILDDGSRDAPSMTQPFLPEVDPVGGYRASDEGFAKFRDAKRASVATAPSAPVRVKTFEERQLDALRYLWELLEVRTDAKAERAQRALASGSRDRVLAHVLGRCAGCNVPLPDPYWRPRPGKRELEPRPSKTTLYCSKKCASAAGRRRARQVPKLREKRDRCTAPGCRKKVPGQNTTYCTARCRDAARSGRRRTRSARSDAVSIAEAGT